MRASPRKAISILELLNEAIAETEKPIPIPRTERENAEMLAKAVVRIADFLREGDAETRSTTAEVDDAEQKTATAPLSAAELEAELTDWRAWWSRPLPESPTPTFALLLTDFPTLTGPIDGSVIANPAVPGWLRLEHRLHRSLPGWVPFLVGRVFARLVLAAALRDCDIEPVVPLGKDPRMKSVWSELERRFRHSRRYVHPARVRCTGHDEPDQQSAMAVLFAAALEFYYRPVRAATKRDLTHWQKALDVMRRAVPLKPHRIIWENGQFLNLDIEEGELRGAALNALVDRCERMLAERYGVQSGLLIRRHTGVHWKNPATHLAEPPELRPFIIRTVDLTRELFDKPLYGCVATIASVLFQPLSVTVSRVRSCAKSRVQNATSESEKAYRANRDKADRFAAEVLPIVHELQKSGVTGLREVAAGLNERGIRTRRNGKWHASTVRNLLARDKRQHPQPS